MPEALAALPPRAARRACGSASRRAPRIASGSTAQLSEAGIDAEVSSFFTDVPERLARAHLVICRSGASTIAELAAVGRPALLVPYPHATDDHQTANARAFADAGGGLGHSAAGVHRADADPNALAERLADAERPARAPRHRRGASPPTMRPTGWRALVLGLATERAGSASEERAA